MDYAKTNFYSVKRFDPKHLRKTIDFKREKQEEGDNLPLLNDVKLKKPPTRTMTNISNITELSLKPKQSVQFSPDGYNLKRPSSISSRIR
jgi:hypothetical protein